jgi:hypothetical protein
MQSVPVAIANSILDQAMVYSIQHYVNKFVSELWQVGGFLWVLQLSPPRKLTATV